MARTAYASYVAFFSTPEKADLAISILNGELNLQIKPIDAADILGLTWPPPAGPRPDDGFIFGPPWYLNSNIANPGPSGVLLDGTHDTYTVPGQVVGNGFPNSDVLTVRWSLSVIVLGPEYSGADPLLIAPIPSRRWAIGFEVGVNAEGHPQAGTGNKARDSSRTVDGVGVKYRGESHTSLVEFNLSASEGTGLPTKKSWERFYIRLRKLGTNTGDIWSCSGTSTVLSGAALRVNTDGSLTAFNVDGSGIKTTNFGSTPALELDVWYKVDILVTFATGVLNGTMRVYLNGVQYISGVEGTGSVGLGQNQNHRASLVFNFTANTWEIDFDDWHNAEIPNIGGVETLNSIDWLIGTHVKSSFVFAGVATNWVGIIAAMDGYKNQTGSTLTLVSSTANAVIDITTDLQDYGDAETQDVVFFVIMGAATVSVSIAGQQTGLAGQLGYRIAGGGSVLTAAPLSGTAFWVVETYLPSGSLTPYPITPFHTVYQKGADANAHTIAGLVACCQYIGLWGAEDARADSPGLPMLGTSLLHNCRYPNSFWGIVTAKPDGPVCVTCNRYTGNGTFQTLGVFLPFQILVIRNTAAGAPVMVFSTSLGPQISSIGQSVAADIPIIQIDPITGLATFEVVGNGARVNQVGVVYEFFLFSDPALRYSLAGVFNHGSQTATYNNELIDGTFTPQYGMFMATPGNPGGIWFKGPSHVGQEVSAVAGTLLTNAVQFATGNLITGDGISEANNETSFDLFRTIDGSGLVMVQIISYVGNGVASRVIPLTPVSGRFPLVAFVTRRGTTGTFYRDAFHAGLNSTPLSSGGSVTTGIIGGAIDSITVGIGLNASGGEYDVCVFPGTSSGWIEGTYCGPGGIPPGDFWDPDPEPLPPGVIITGEGGLILSGGETSLSLFKNLSGIYTLTPNKHTDTFYDRQTAQPSVEVAIPNPNFKTGYIGG